AEAWAKRSGLVEWGNHPRRRTSDANWNKPLKWNRQAEAAGVRIKVFCASLADWLDNQVPYAWQLDLGILVEATPHLDWLLLTKRPQNFAARSPWQNGELPQNVWLGTTVENQEEADRRIPHLVAIDAAKRFLSCEPLLGPIDLTHIPGPDTFGEVPALALIDLVIVGGESGPGARPMHPDWARSLRDQCQAAGVPFFFKQWGEWFPGELNDGGDCVYADPDIDHDPSADTWDFRRAKYTSIDGTGMLRVGKKRAGRLLDGRAWDEVPT